MDKDRENENTYHVLIRYSDNYAPKEGTIPIHGSLLKKHRYVWLGKFGGSHISISKKEAIQRQIAAGEESYLLLAKSVTGSPNLVIGAIKDVRRGLPNEELEKVPEYYRNRAPQVSVWFKITEFWTVDIEVLRKFTVASSGCPALQSLLQGMSTILFLLADSDFSLVKSGAKKLIF